MNRASRFRWHALAIVAISALMLAGCAALGVDHPKEGVAQRPSRPALVRVAIEHLKYGNSAPFELCAGDTCPKPTTKSFTRAAQTSSTDLVVMPVALPTIAASSPESPVALIPPDENKPAVEPASKSVVINFASGAAMLTPAARKTLDAIAPDAETADTIEIRGRTDELGSAQVNELLARNRAIAVRDYLRKRKLSDRTLIRVSAKGACCYVAGNDTEEGRSANRRVEIEFKTHTQPTLGSDRNDRL